MEGIVLHLFGPPEAALPHGEPARELASPKCLALLAFLALEPGPHPREELATLLWGDFPEPAARASLRQALKRIRDAIGGQLRLEQNTAQLVGPLSCDAIEFLDAVGRDPAAARFDVTHFLSGLAPHRAPGFDEWASAKRRRLLRQYEEVIADVVRTDLTASRVKELHRALALALQDAPGGDPREAAGEIAHHADRGGESDIAFRHALVASEAATARYAFDEALSWLDLAAGACGSEEQTKEVNRRTADVLRLAGWTEPPQPVRRPGTPARGFVQSDLDLQAEEGPR